MLKGLHTAEKAMNIQLTRTNVLANNLANVNSAGFKQILTSVTESATNSDTAISETSMGQRGDINLDVKSPIDMSQGALRETGNSTDLAINGDGFFKINRNGTEFFTRNGAFTINSERKLVTMNGDEVQGKAGPITIPVGEILINNKGEISVNGNKSSQIAIFEINDFSALSHVGESRFLLADEAAASQKKDTEIEVVQGMLEQSNVNTIDTMVAMIAAQRAFELESKVLQAADRTLDKSVNELSRKA